MKPRYTIRCFSRVDGDEVVGHGGFPLYFSTRRRAMLRLDALVRDGGARSIYRYELESSGRAISTGYQ